MSTAIGSILLGVKYKEESRKDVKRLLEEENYNELQEAKADAMELVSTYNNIFDTIGKYVEEPSQTSFAVSMTLNPKNFWRQLGYCEGLSETGEYDL